MSGNDRRTRLVVKSICTDDLAVFEKLARAAAAMQGPCEVSFDIAHISDKDPSFGVDPGDAFPQYIAYYPHLFLFSAPPPARRFFDAKRVGKNLDTARRKADILAKLGLRAAAFFREPAAMPGEMFEKHPRWRGPRVDYPGRSRAALFALTLHEPEVRELYRAAVADFLREIPEVDTFLWYTNDCAAGFDYYPEQYAGPNGPERFRERKPQEAVAAFHRAVIDGGRDAGRDVMSLMAMCDSIWDQSLVPPAVHSISLADGEREYVGLSLPSLPFLWKPLDLLKDIDKARSQPGPFMFTSLGRNYFQSCADPDLARLHFALAAEAWADGKATGRLPGRAAFLESFLAREFGRRSAEAMVDGWLVLDGLRSIPRCPGGLWYVPDPVEYGSLSMRWLTRPLVPFPERLTGAEVADWLPHVFSSYGDRDRITNLSDIHHINFAEPTDDYRLYSNIISKRVEIYREAVSHFERAASALAAPNPLPALFARSAGFAACLWQNGRNWMEYAILLRQAAGVPDEEISAASGRYFGDEGTYQQVMFTIMRRELDNCLELDRLLAEDEQEPPGRRALLKAAEAGAETSFMFGPGLRRQLARKTETMLRHWEEVSLLRPGAERAARRLIYSHSVTLPPISYFRENGLDDRLLECLRPAPGPARGRTGGRRPGK